MLLVLIELLLLLLLLAGGTLRGWCAPQRSSGALCWGAVGSDHDPAASLPDLHLRQEVIIADGTMKIMSFTEDFDHKD